MNKTNIFFIATWQCFAWLLHFLSSEFTENTIRGHTGF